ncbi:hypothetical protein [Allokutzneria albata]|uniref:hypothetical protein n=1 Tax=Allokutzneria albata TaxID=211114 RepID=UPI0004C40144|nr:hypothetical protein [Allokutzneria albata]
MKTSRITAALLAALAMTGCAGGPPPPPASQVPTATGTTTTAPTTTTTTTTAAATPTAAADGADYKVCATRSCEVAVSKPVEIRFGGSAPGKLSIKKVAAGEVDFDLALNRGGGGSGTLKPGCSAFSFGGGGGFGSFGGPNAECAAKMPDARPGSVTLQLPGMGEGTAILRIVTG